MTAADTDTSEVEKMFAVNVFGPMRMVHHFHRMLVAAKGTVVNIGSIGGIVPYVYGGMPPTRCHIYMLISDSELQCKQGSSPSLWKHLAGRNEAIRVDTSDTIR